MCVHPTKSGNQCRKNPELFLCGTHLLNVKTEVVTEHSIIDLFERKFDSSKAKAVLDPDRVDLWVFCGNNIAQADVHGVPTGSRPGRLFNGSDYMGELVRIVGTDHYAVYTHDGNIVSARQLVSDPPTSPTPTPVGKTIMCGNCRKRGVEHPYHNSVAQVQQCYNSDRSAS